MAFFKKLFGKKDSKKANEDAKKVAEEARAAEEQDLIDAGILAPKAEDKAAPKKATPKAESKPEVKADAPKAEPKPAEKKPTAKVDAPKAEVKPAEKKPAAKADAPKAEEKPAAKKPAAKVDAPKAEEKPAEKKPAAKADAPKAEENPAAKKPAAKAATPKAEEVVEEKSIEEIDAAFKEDAPVDISKEVALAEAKSGKKLARFEIKKSKDNRFVFNLYAPNRVIVATSQIYSSSPSAVNGIKSIAVNAPKAPIEDTSLKSYVPLGFPKWEIYVDKGGQFRFRLYAPNGSCIVHSQGYTTKASCKNGIASIIKNAPEAIIDKSYLKKDD